MHKVKGVVSTGRNQPVSVETILVPDPGPGEVLVDVLTCGVCQTDHHYVEGGVGDDYPFLLGHESAGVVSAVGEGVTEVAVGDHVILNWRAVCGQCRACRKGEPWYCFDTHNATQKMTLEDGTELAPALGIGAFAEKTLVAAGQCTKVDAELAPEQYAAVGLLGCGVMAGIGAVLNTGALRRGESVAVIGCGGVGAAAVAGAALGGATTIVAVDLDDDKLDTARRFGATHTVNSRREDPVAAIRELTGGHGADLVIDAVGIAPTFAQAFEARDLAGRLVLVGVPAPGTTWEAPLDQVFGHGGAIKSAWYGDTLPSRDFPMLVDQYLLGRLDLDGFVTERIGLEDVDEAFARMRTGAVLRSVVEIARSGTAAAERTGTAGAAR
ncbi:S-(hydroxymethyl)mycothiol dehydrogenase [Kocuria sp. LUK]|uniref:S-(hydroxymethyl)mycothiol dehydrogenase n=1 Tax=Kocuria sp. LUK TaxID=2897828 RepID=UPI001E3FFB91|nr:S-(hydroxymethyl)mycothiol dehydrogenase [Kocuria sp. LUK]MCD1144512.1 S-(hydroxymethyl)mycothiol dehydrogenase [Kocuria sp. LUK]